MKKVFLLLLVFSYSYKGFGQPDEMIDQIRTQSNGTSVWRAGQDSWIFHLLRMHMVIILKNKLPEFYLRNPHHILHPGDKMEIR